MMKLLIILLHLPHSMKIVRLIFRFQDNFIHSFLALMLASFECEPPATVNEKEKHKSLQSVTNKKESLLILL